MSESRFGNMKFNPQTGKIEVVPPTEKQRDEKQSKGWAARAELWEKGGVQPYDKTLVTEFVRGYFFQDLAEPAQVLDLAVGTESYLAERATDRVIQSDLLFEMLSLNKKPGEKVVANAKRLPFPDNSFDRVLNTFMVRYLDSKYQLDSIGEMVRVTRTGGKIFIVDFATIGYKLEVGVFEAQRTAKFLTDFQGIFGKEVEVQVIQLKDFSQVNQGSPGDLYALVITVGEEIASPSKEKGSHDTTES